MGIAFGSKHKSELHDTIDWLNKQDITAIQNWLLNLENKRIAIRILSLDDDFIHDYIDPKMLFELFKIMPFALTQIDWVIKHPRSATGMLWYFERGW